MVVVTTITFNLFAIIDGVKFCQNTDLGGLCSETTSTIFDLNGTYWYYWNGMILVPVSRNDAISSIQVGYHWEAYVCSNNNNGGTCKIFFNDDPAYQSSGKTFNMTDYSMNDTISSITIQPATFERARNFYMWSEVPNQTTRFGGYAYLYGPAGYYQPTTQGATSGFRLFLKDGDDITSLANYIVKNNQISSALIFGNDILYLYTDTNHGGSLKILTSSQRDFTLDLSPYDYTIWDIGTWQDNVESVKLQSSIGSFGMFISNDTEMHRNGETCYEFNEYFDYARHECQKYGQTWYSVGSLGAYDYVTQLQRRSVSLEEDFYDKGDSFDLIWIEGHGAYDESASHAWVEVAAASKDISGTDYRVWIGTSDSGIYAQWDSYIGTLNTDWFYTGACHSMMDVDISYADYVIPAWSDALVRLHGVGGMRDLACWVDGALDPYDRNDVWTLLDSYPAGQSWVDAMENDYYSCDRWPRFITREKYDCTTHPADTYMYHDFFPGISEGQMTDKGILSEYDYYCVRFADDQDDDLNSYYIPTNSFNRFNVVKPMRISPVLNTSARNVKTAMANGTFNVYLSEYASPEAVVAKLGLNTSSMKKSQKGKATIYEDGSYKLAMRKYGYGLYAQRQVEIIEPHFDMKEIKEVFREEAETLAKSLTTLPLVFDKVAEDASVSFQQVGDIVTKTGRVVNKLKYIFHPVIDGIAVLDSGITVQYDADGLFMVSNNVPYRINKVKAIENLKSETELTDYVSAQTGENEKYDASKVFYAMRNDGLMVPAYIYKRENTVYPLSLDKDLPIE